MKDILLNLSIYANFWGSLHICWLWFNAFLIGHMSVY